MSVVINGSAGVTVNSGAVLGITSGTAVASTSGTSIDFTSIPSWVKRITVMFNGVSTNGTSNVQVQLGASGSVDAAGYTGTATKGTGYVLFTTGFGLAVSITATSIFNGQILISRLSGNTWAAQGILGFSDAATICTGAGSKTLSAEIDRIRITTVNGTDTFDAGSINILYE
jgi:hypothetical protein